MDSPIGRRLPVCDWGLICRQDGLTSTPGAEKTCQYAKQGEVCQRDDSDGDFYILCEEGFDCHLDDSEAYEGSVHTCVRVGRLGEACDGLDESTGEQLPACGAGLMCREAGLTSIPGAGKTCQYAQLGEACGLNLSCEEDLQCRWDFDHDFYADEEESGTCELRPGAGEECEDWELCQDGLMCRWDY